MSSNHLASLVERRNKTWEEAKALLDHVEEHQGGEFTAEQDEQWSRQNDEIDTIDKRIADVKAKEARAAELDEIADRVGPQAEAEMMSQRQKDNKILRSIAAGEKRSFEFRDLTVGTATAGGNTVPTSFYGQLVEHMIEHSAIRQTNVTVLNTDGGENLQVPKTTGKSTATIVAEGAVIGESDPAFGQVTLGAFKYGFAIQVSSELEQDTGVDLVGFLARQGGQALGDGSGAHFITGTGSGQPNGIFTAATVGKTGATGQTTTVTYDDLVDLQHSVISPYRRNAFWVLNDSSLAVIRKIKDSNGNPIWQAGLVSDAPNQILGDPYVTDPNAPVMAASAESILYGDISAYFIRDVNGVRVERSTEFAFTSDLVTWRFLLRTDGDLVDTTGAVKTYQNSAT